MGALTTRSPYAARVMMLSSKGWLTTLEGLNEHAARYIVHETPDVPVGALRTAALTTTWTRLSLGPRISGPRDCR